MQVLKVSSEGPKLKFKDAQGLAHAMAGELYSEPICLAFYDGERDFRSPQNVECHDCCDLPGYAEYAINRGASLRIIFDDGESEFYFREV